MPREDSLKILEDLLDEWHDQYRTNNYDPASLLEKICDVIEEETEYFYKTDPDPFDERHPSRIDSEGILGQLLKSVVRHDLFMSTLVNDYMNNRNRENEDRINSSACRLFIDILPGMETSFVLSEAEGLLNRLYQWAQFAKEPLSSYAIGIIGSAMEIPELAGETKEKNANLVPIMLRKLKSLCIFKPVTSIKSTKESNEYNLDEFDSKKPFAEIFVSNNEQNDKQLKNADNINNVHRFYPPNTVNNTMHSKDSSADFIQDTNSNSNWAEMQYYMIGSYRMNPLTSQMKQRLILKYLTALGGYQEHVATLFDQNVLSLLLNYIDMAAQNVVLLNTDDPDSSSGSQQVLPFDACLAFKALHYLASLFVHKKFALAFIAAGGVQKLLEIKRPSMAATGISLCLYYLAYYEDAMERICQLPYPTLEKYVEYVLWLLMCSHQSGRTHAVLFLSVSFPFRIILDIFDRQDGLRKLVNNLNTLQIYVTDFDDGPENPAHHLSEDDLFVQRQACRYTLLALKRYLEARLVILSGANNGINGNNNRYYPSPYDMSLSPSSNVNQPYKAIKLTPELMQKVMNYIIYMSKESAKTSKLVLNNENNITVLTNWTPSVKLVRLGILRLLLRTCLAAGEWTAFNARHEVIRHALEIIKYLTFLQPGNQLALCKSLNSCSNTNKAQSSTNQYTQSRKHELLRKSTNHLEGNNNANENPSHKYPHIHMGSATKSSRDYLDTTSVNEYNSITVLKFPHLKLPNNNPGLDEICGMAIILACAEPRIINDPEVQKHALSIIINCVCNLTQNSVSHHSSATTSLSNFPLSTTTATNTKRKSQNFGVSSSGVSIDDSFPKVWRCIRNNNGLMVLLNLLTIRMPLNDADEIRYLSCRALCGLLRSETVRQIVAKLPLFNNGQIQLVMREPVLQDNLATHQKFCSAIRHLLAMLKGNTKASFDENDLPFHDYIMSNNNMTPYSLAAITTNGTGPPHFNIPISNTLNGNMLQQTVHNQNAVNATSLMLNNAVPSSTLDYQLLQYRAHVVAQTRITFSRKELLYLIFNYLNDNGMYQTAHSLFAEAKNIWLGGNTALSEIGASGDHNINPCTNINGVEVSSEKKKELTQTNNNLNAIDFNEDCYTYTGNVKLPSTFIPTNGKDHSSQRYNKNLTLNNKFLVNLPSRFGGFQYLNTDMNADSINFGTNMPDMKYDSINLTALTQNKNVAKKGIKRLHSMSPSPFSSQILEREIHDLTTNKDRSHSSKIKKFRAKHFRRNSIKFESPNQNNNNAIFMQSSIKHGVTDNALHYSHKKPIKKIKFNRTFSDSGGANKENLTSNTPAHKKTPTHSTSTKKDWQRTDDIFYQQSPALRKLQQMTTNNVLHQSTAIPTFPLTECISNDTIINGIDNKGGHHENHNQHLIDVNSFFSTNNNTETIITKPPIKLDDIVREYLREQHSHCVNPMVICPPFSLLAPHQCPVPRNRRCAPFNITRRQSRISINPLYGGLDGKLMNKKYVYGRMRGIKVFKDMDDDALMTCCTFQKNNINTLYVGTETGDLKCFNVDSGLVECIYSLETTRDSQDDDSGPNDPIIYCSFWPLYNGIFASRNKSNRYLNTMNTNARNILLTYSFYQWKHTSYLWSLDPYDTARDSVITPMISLKPKLTFKDLEYPVFNNLGHQPYRIVGTEAEKAHVYDVETGMRILSLYDAQFNNGYTKNRAFYSPDDEHILSDGILWDADTGRWIHKFDKLNPNISGQFHPNGYEVLINSEIWDLRTFKLLNTIPSLDQCRTTFNPTNEIIYAMRYLDTDDDRMNDQAYLSMSRFDTSIKVLDSNTDYQGTLSTNSQIATIDMRRIMYDMCPESSDRYMVIIEGESLTNREPGNINATGGSTVGGNINTVGSGPSLGASSYHPSHAGLGGMMGSSINPFTALLNDEYDDRRTCRLYEIGRAKDTYLREIGEEDTDVDPEEMEDDEGDDDDDDSTSTHSHSHSHSDSNSSDDEDERTLGSTTTSTTNSSSQSTNSSDDSEGDSDITFVRNSRNEFVRCRRRHRRHGNRREGTSRRRNRHHYDDDDDHEGNILHFSMTEDVMSDCTHGGTTQHHPLSSTGHNKQTDATLFRNKIMNKLVKPCPGKQGSSKCSSSSSSYETVSMFSSDEDQSDHSHRSRDSIQSAPPIDFASKMKSLPSYCRDDGRIDDTINQHSTNYDKKNRQRCYNNNKKGSTDKNKNLHAFSSLSSSGLQKQRSYDLSVINKTDTKMDKRNHTNLNESPNKTKSICANLDKNLTSHKTNSAQSTTSCSMRSSSMLTSTTSQSSTLYNLAGGVPSSSCSHTPTPIPSTENTSSISVQHGENPPNVNFNTNNSTISKYVTNNDSIAKHDDNTTIINDNIIPSDMEQHYENDEPSTSSKYIKTTNTENNTTLTGENHSVLVKNNTIDLDTTEHENRKNKNSQQGKKSRTRRYSATVLTPVNETSEQNERTNRTVTPPQNQIRTDNLQENRRGRRRQQRTPNATIIIASPSGDFVLPSALRRSTTQRRGINTITLTATLSPPRRRSSRLRHTNNNHNPTNSFNITHSNSNNSSSRSRRTRNTSRTTNRRHTRNTFVNRHETITEMDEN